ncbi:MAG: FmdE family protein [Deltaproteobacteria bacterium]|jgi:formylmethanofuran dehydrogenase subunit E|nr:FmdE family protein [Deltaproteobacteria bacterium]
MAHWHDYLDRALAYHGHICSGQILGLRVVLKGLDLLGMDPLEHQRDLMLFIETNRCLADAAFVITGITLGRRRLFLYNYGKAAITFLDLKTGEAWRVAVNPSIRPDRSVRDVIAFWNRYSDEEVLLWHQVEVDLKPGDLPGPPSRRIQCAICGEDVSDGRDVLINGREVCRPCAGEAYYRLQEDSGRKAKGS